MFNDEIVCSAYNTESFRLIRLERVVGYVYALSEHYGNNRLLSKISELHDNKGTLVVTWKNSPAVGEKEIISKAWSSSIGDGADNVEHNLI